MNVAILGLGEVGSAIKKLTSKKHNVFVRELDYDEIGGEKINVLHVCIPYSNQFEKTVIDAIKEMKPSLTIINSTVRPGTTAAIHKQTGGNLAHAPILGVHPHLYKYLFKFTKPIGAVTANSYRRAKQHFNELGVKTTKFDSSNETELAKILSTTYYGWNILFEKWVHTMAEKTGTNYKQVYKEFNTIYNMGYKKDAPHVTRPVLKHFDGEIGGHCVIPNTHIINAWLHDDFTAFMLKQNKKLAK